MTIRTLWVAHFAALTISLAAAQAGTTVGTAFTYQGQLKKEGAPYTGSADFEIKLFSVASGGEPPLAEIQVKDAVVENGLFSLELDFGAGLFDGSPRFLGIGVRAPHEASATAFTELEGRQPVTAAPYALHAFNVPTIEETNWRNNGSDVFLPTGNVGVGVESPEALLHLRRPLADTGIRFQTVRFAEGPPASLLRSPGGTTLGGTGQAWSSPDSARISDDVRSTVNLAGTAGGVDFQESQSVNLTNCGFAIPAQAQVVGIQVGVEGQGDCSCSDCDRCIARVSVELLGGDGPASLGSISPTPAEGIVNIGGTFELWGLEWSAGQVNDPGFGVRFAGSLGLLNTFICFPGLGCSYLDCDCTGTGSLAVDAVSVTVFFYDTSVTSTPVDWSLGIPEASSALHLSPRADLSSPAIYVDTGGHVGINTTAPGTFHLAVVGFAAKSTGTQWTTLSDRRLKRNIEPISGALSQLLGLRGVSFEFTEEGLATGLAEKGRHTGFIAQDVEQAFPGWVDEAGNGYKFVTEEGTTALVVEALRELRAEKDAQIKELIERVERLERERARLPVLP